MSNEKILDRMWEIRYTDKDKNGRGTGSIMWTIKHIFDGDYGCEGLLPGQSPKVSVTLIDEHGKERYVSVEDAWLTEQGLDVGDIWPCKMETLDN